MRRAGIRVRGDLCAPEGELANEAYFKFMTTGLPFVTVKVASTLDGKISTARRDAKWITDTRARALGRELRRENQAVLVGIGTLLADDPHLGSRVRGSPDPWRIVLDSRLRIPLKARVVRSRRLIVATTEAAHKRRARALEDRGVEIWRFPGKHRVPLKPLLRKLARRGIISILVEGGGQVLGSFFDQNLVDKVHWFLAPKILGAANAVSAVEGRGAAKLADAMELQVTSFSQVGGSWLLTAYPMKR